MNIELPSPIFLVGATATGKSEIALALAELIDVSIVIVHVSNREAMEEIRRAQMRGLKVHGETCPQYLVLTEDDLKDLGMEGAKYVCSPPPRDHASQQACWEGLQQGVFSLFSSDHCPFRYDDKAAQNSRRPLGLHRRPVSGCLWVGHGEVRSK